MHQAIRMAFGAGGKLIGRYAQILMLILHLYELMFVAFVTAEFAVGRSMAYLTLHLPFFSMIDWELVTDQLSWIPAGSIMAIFALETEETSMDLRFWVTIFTLSWCPLIYLPYMASLAIDLPMTAY